MQEVVVMKRVTESLREYTEREILPRYDGYDAAHRRDHVEGVVSRSLEFAERFDVDVDMVYAAAAWHDLGLCYGRETHHLTSAQMVRESAELRAWFNEEQIEIIAEAVEDHRASAERAPRSTYGVIVAEADRQIVPEVVMRRTVQYGLSHYPELSKEAQWERFVGHLREKYDHGGYLKLYIEESENGRQLGLLREIIARPEELRERFERLWSELTE